MTWLFTGFEPFGTHDVNPSLAAAQSAAGETGGRFDPLPVTWAVALDRGREAEGGVDGVVHLGLAASATLVRLERTATNLAGKVPDNEGVRRPGPLDPEGPLRVHILPVWDPLLMALSRHSPEVAGWSEDCGDYICNATLYRGLCARPALPRVFVHLPLWDPARAAAFGRALGQAIRSLRR
jgi:pyroglutamyl-peptidase